MSISRYRLGRYSENSNTLLLSPDASLKARGASGSCEKLREEEILPAAELLVRASDAIRIERARADALEHENACLRTQLNTARGTSSYTGAPRPSRTFRPGAATSKASQEDSEKDACHDAKQAPPVDGKVSASLQRDENYLLHDGRDERPRQRSTHHPRIGFVSSPLTKSQAASGRFSAQVTHSFRKGWNAEEMQLFSAASPTLPTSGHLLLTTTQNVPPEALQPVSARYIKLKPGNEINQQSPPSPPKAEFIEGMQLSRHSPLQSMKCRLRRALAPRPSEDALGDIVHTMVISLVHDAKAVLRCARDDHAAVPACPRDFALIRLKPCVYQLLLGASTEVHGVLNSARNGCGGLQHPSPSPSASTTGYNGRFQCSIRTRDSCVEAKLRRRVSSIVLRLTIDSGALRVIRGGGHVDFIEYLERRLRIKI